MFLYSYVVYVYRLFSIPISPISKVAAAEGPVSGVDCLARASQHTEPTATMVSPASRDIAVEDQATKDRRCFLHVEAKILGVFSFALWPFLAQGGLCLAGTLAHRIFAFGH